MQLAIALYNNNVDDEDELEFRKGDILTVLIENPNGFDGWWLCKHHDKCGLCPGNRLKLIQNTESSPMKLNDFMNSRLSTASMYDRLSINYDNTRKTLSSDHDYDNPKESDFISNLKPIDSSPESSSRSSGIYSTNDLHLSSSSSEFYPTNLHNKSLFSNNQLVDLDQLEKSFQKYSIHSLLIHKYRQLISQTNLESFFQSFINECHLFLDNYGCLLDRSSYRSIKENFLYELEQKKNKQRIQLATKIIQLIDLRLKEKPPNSSFIPNDVFKKLHLEPIEEIPNEKLSTSYSSTHIYANPRREMKTSKTCHSNFLTSSSYHKFDHSDYIDDDDYSINPLIKCYYRHINEQVNSIIKRYSYLLENENNISLLVSEGKGLVVAGHKLIFVLETLREHLQQIQTSLIHLTTQLCEALTNFIQLLKQFSQQNSTNIRKLIIRFKYDIEMIMNIVRKIKQQCT